MTGQTLRMPPFKVAAAILRKTTEHLAREVVAPTETAPDWNELDWAIARSVAAMQGISTLLANRLRWRGPQSWESFLAEQKKQSLLREEKIGRVLSQLDSEFQAAEVTALALKGSALRRFALYLPGERPQSDVDLLIETEQLTNTMRALRNMDYVPAFTSRRHAVFEPSTRLSPKTFGEHVDHPLKIEVHTEISERLPASKVDITTSLWPTQLSSGLNAYPDRAALALHLLLHFAGNMRAHALRQIQLQDFAAFAQLLSEKDWEQLLADDSSGNTRWWLYPPLALTDRYYPGHMPSNVLKSARRACPAALRIASDRTKLSSVSWSNLRIHAFPGIAWSRSPLEVLRLGRSRLFPSRVALDELATAVETQPRLNRVDWYGVSHINRILRWVFLRPPRVQTVTSVLSALDSANSKGR